MKKPGRESAIQKEEQGVKGVNTADREVQTEQEG